MSTPDRRLHWLGSSAERTAILGGYDRIMSSFDRPDIVPRIFEGEVVSEDAPTPMKRAAWILNPARSHKYLANLIFPPLALVRPDSRSFYSDLSDAGGVNDALWAEQIDPEKSLAVAQNAAEKGFSIVRPILSRVKVEDVLGRPFERPYHEDLLRHDYEEAINGHVRLHPSLLIMQKIINHMCDGNFSPTDALFGLAATVGSVQATQYIDADLGALEKSKRHRMYDGALIHACDLANRSYGQTALAYLLSQKATAAFLEIRRNQVNETQLP